jgi:hypothetical protein
LPIILTCALYEGRLIDLWFVTGRDFSRADRTPPRIRALAPVELGFSGAKAPIVTGTVAARLTRLLKKSEQGIVPPAEAGS